MMRKRHESKSSASSHESYMELSSPPAARMMKSESQESQGQSQRSATGMSQDFFSALNMNDDNLPEISSQSDAALSVGIVCVMDRPTTNKKQKDIKKFALQKTFYAFPKDCNPEIKAKIQQRIENDIADFKLQKYNVSIHRFGLPFDVEEVCCVSGGYNLVPKILRAPRQPSPPSSSAKRKRGRNKGEDSDGDIAISAGAYKDHEFEDPIEQVSSNLRSNAKKIRK